MARINLKNIIGRRNGESSAVLSIIDQLNAVYDRSDLQSADKIRLRDEVALMWSRQAVPEAVPFRLSAA